MEAFKNMNNRWKLYERLDAAYGTSTQSNNKFKQLIEKISWEKSFEADGELYFCKDGLTLTTPSLDPFDCPWKPSVMMHDGCLIDLGL